LTFTDSAQKNFQLRTRIARDRTGMQKHLNTSEKKV